MEQIMLPVAGRIAVCKIKVLPPGRCARVPWSPNREKRSNTVGDVQDFCIHGRPSFMGIEAQAPPDAPADSARFRNVIRLIWDSGIGVTSWIWSGEHSDHAQ